jgi:hypothetical protein
MNRILNFSQMNLLTIIISSGIIFLGDGLGSTYGGVEFTGRNFKLWKSIISGETGDGAGEIELVKSMEKRSKPVVYKIGRFWDKKLTFCRSDKTSHRWIRDLLLDYRKIDASEENKKNGQELEFRLDYFIFSPDVSQEMPDGIVFRTRYQPWLPLDELVPCLLNMWAREMDGDYIGDLEKMGNEALSRFINEKTDDNLINYMISCRYNSAAIQKLKTFAVDIHDQERQLIALKILAFGIWIDDPAFFGRFLRSPDRLISRAAMIALFLIPGDKGMGELKKNIKNLQVHLNSSQLEKLKGYLKGL